MLCTLRIQSLAVVDATEIDFTPGLNVITGETGAGKSILIKALDLVMGGRATSDLVRTGCPHASVEAVFDFSNLPDRRRMVKEVTDEDDHELVLRRVVSDNGRSRAYANGVLCTAGQLKRITAGLVDVCSQHEHHSLSDPATHMELLDAAARLNPARQDMVRGWELYRSADRALETAVQTHGSRAEREAILRFQHDEIASVDPKSGEYESLEERCSRLENAERLVHATSTGEYKLYSSDNSAYAQICRVASELNAVASADPDLAVHAGRLQAAADEIADVSDELRRYHQSLSASPGDLDEVATRLQTLRRLMRKYGATLDEVIAKRKRLAAELGQLDNAEELLDALHTARERAAKEVARLARLLADRRRNAASPLAEAITAELRSLSMGDATVQVDVAPMKRAGNMAVDGAGVSSTGMDRVEFLIAPNRGESPRPLRKIASGGELSRALLAVKRVLADVADSATYVFDEVDSGIGGETARVIGAKLAEVAHHHQVVCITHQPLIAAWGSHHLAVRKQTVDDRTTTSVVSLDIDGRVEELARMLGGADRSTTSRTAAAELIASCAP